MGRGHGGSATHRPLDRSGPHITEETVKTHVSNILRKLGARDRAAAIVVAFDHGLVQPGGA